MNYFIGLFSGVVDGFLVYYVTGDANLALTTGIIVSTIVQESRRIKA